MLDDEESYGLKLRRKDKPTWGCDEQRREKEKQSVPKSEPCVMVRPPPPFASIHEGRQNPSLHFTFKLVSPLGSHSETTAGLTF